MSDAPRTRRWLWFALALALQVAIVGGLATFHAATANSSKAVYLRLQPVDPRDPLRGDYVTVSYDISTLSADLVQSPFSPTGETTMPPVGTRVWVPLVRVGKVWEAQPGVATTLPDLDDEEARGWYSPEAVFISGVVAQSSANSITVTYGIEEYFIPEGTGATWPTGTEIDATARVLVAPGGTAQVQQLFLDGRPWP